MPSALHLWGDGPVDSKAEEEAPAVDSKAEEENVHTKNEAAEGNNWAGDARFCGKKDLTAYCKLLALILFT